MKVWKRALMSPYNWIMIWNPCRWLVRIFSCSGRCTEISLKFYGQSAILDWFVRKQNVFYGQTVIFDHFVRNRHFSSRLITDKVPIFIDLSVNDNDFAKCSAAHHLLNYCTWPWLRAKRWFLRFARNLRPHCFGKGNWVEHFLNFGWFCSTFGAARAEFGVGGRTFFKIFEILFYFRSSAPWIWSRR